MSSLLSPCWRSPNDERQARRCAGVRARSPTMSSRILKPSEESGGASSSQRVAPHHEEAAHRIAHRRAEQRAARARSTDGSLLAPAFAVPPPSRRRRSGSRPRDRRRRRAAAPAWRSAASRRAAGRRPSRRRSAPGSPACRRGRRRRGRAGRCGGCSARARRVAPIARDAATVPSGELSSTKITSQSTPASARASFSTSAATLSRSVEGRNHDAQLGRRAWRERSRADVGKARSLRRGDMRCSVAFQCRRWTLTETHAIEAATPRAELAGSSGCSVRRQRRSLVCSTISTTRSRASSTGSPIRRAAGAPRSSSCSAMARSGSSTR